jgi:porin
MVLSTIHTRRSLAPLACAGLALMLAVPPAPAQGAACAAASGCPGFDFTAGYTADFRRNTTGGIEKGNAVSGLLEAGAAWRSASLLPGAFVTTSASLIHVGGASVSGDLVGDLQGLNNIEADAGWYLYDLWSEVSFGSRQAASVRAGLLDLNAEFDTSDTAGFFVSPPFGIGTDLAQTGANGPAVFPVTALGVRFGGELGEALQWRFAAYEGTPGRTDRHRFATADLSHGEGALLIGELALAPGGLHKLAFGAWSYTASFERIDAGAAGNDVHGKGNRGAYAMIDAPLGSLGAARVDGMLRAGVADARYNAVGTYVGGAVVVSNLLSLRPDDGLGIAIAHARTGRQFRSQLLANGGQPAQSETAVELTWRAPLGQWLAVVPSVQWVASPGADRAMRNAFVAGFRFEMSWAGSRALLASQPVPEQDPELVVSNKSNQ